MHIFITGGTRGIGYGLVREFLKRNHRVSYTGTSQKSIDLHIDSLKGDFLPMICDVRNIENINKCINEAVDMYGNIDIFINNAGVDQDRDYFYNLSEDEIKKVIDINVTGSILGANQAIKQMINQEYGTVYNLEGLGSNNMVIPQTIIYGSSKRLITYFTKAANKEVKKYSEISVGSIQPGMVFTDLLLKNLGDDGKKVARFFGNHPQEVCNYIVDKIEKGKRIIKFPAMIRAPRNFFKNKDL